MAEEDIKPLQTTVDEAPSGATDASASVNGEEQATPDKPKERKRRLGVDPSLIISESRSKRRRTPTPEPEIHRPDPDPKDPERAKMLGMQIYHKIMNMKDSSGDSMSLPFIKLPNKRQFPDYYEVIKHPMSLEQVHAKLEKAEYETLKEVCADLGQIWNNAKRYNIRDSALFKWAKRLHKMTRTFYNTQTSQKDDTDSEAEAEVDRGAIAEVAVAAAAPDDHGEDDDDDDDGDENAAAGPSSSGDPNDPDGNAQGGSVRKRGTYMKDGPTVYKLIKPVMKAVKEALSDDGENREIASIFLHLPDRRELPDYYKTISDPISLEEIETRMLSRRYDSSDQFFEDMELMCDNAMRYNEDDSEVYSDARQIKRMMGVHRELVRDRIHHVAKLSKTKPSAVTPVRIVSTTTQELISGMPDSVGYPGYPPAPRSQGFPYHTSMPGNNLASSLPSASAPAPTPTPYLPPLPSGVVTEEVVGSLDRYPLYEQQTWVTSLPPLAQAIYRQMVATNEGRKRGAPPAQSPSNGGTLLAELPSSGRPGGISHVYDRLAPPYPTVKYIDFAFSGVPEAVPSRSSPPTTAEPVRQAVRLHNLRGVVTHAVVVGADTTELELTAYVSGHETVRRQSASGEEVTEKPPPAIEVVPEVSLRINGNPASLPRLIYDGEAKDRPAGMRWTVGIPTGRLETKIEVVATKPGALAETCTIFVMRQF